MTKNLGLFDSPIFPPDGDLQVSRKGVYKWGDSLNVAHDKGSDRRLQTMYRLLGRNLYGGGLPEAQKAIVDEAQEKVEIDYLQMDNTVEAALQIIRLVAVDPPITIVTRLISSYHKVTGCHREENEKLSFFVPRFRGLAANQLCILMPLSPLKLEMS